jgi:hypothetical protein
VPSKSLKIIKLSQADLVRDPMIQLRQSDVLNDDLTTAITEVEVLAAEL